MSNYLIQGETLTGIADAIRAKSGNSDAIKVSDFATQIEEIEGSGGGGSTKKTILAETTYEGFFLNEELGMYNYLDESVPFVLTEGETYKVVWDGEEYECVAQDMSVLLEGAIAIGNLANLGGTGNNEPFIIAYFSTGVLYISFDTKTIHTVEIYQGEEQFTGVETSVTLDFSGGDMEVSPNDGEAFSKVSIPKPSTLIAENIADGIDIAGIIGTLAAGGGGAKIEVVSLPYPEAEGAKEHTLQHNLGVIPDIIFYSFGAVAPESSVSIALGFSSAFVAAYPMLNFRGFIRYKTASSTLYYTANLGQMDVLTSGKGFHNVTDKSFSIGDSDSGLDIYYSHKFLLIGGLT